MRMPGTGRARALLILADAGRLDLTTIRRPFHGAIDVVKHALVGAKSNIRDATAQSKALTVCGALSFVDLLLKEQQGISLLSVEDVLRALANGRFDCAHFRTTGPASASTISDAIKRVVAGGVATLLRPPAEVLEIFRDKDRSSTAAAAAAVEDGPLRSRPRHLTTRHAQMVEDAGVSTLSPPVMAITAASVQPTTPPPRIHPEHSNRNCTAQCRPLCRHRP